MNRKFIYTNKSHSPRAVMSTILGVITMISLWYAVYITYQNAGEALPRYGATTFFITILAFIGLILGILSKTEPDRFYMFSYIGIGINILVLSGISFILFAGAYGL